MFANPVYVGVDLGQRNDPSAIAVVEEKLENGKLPWYAVRGAMTTPLGTPYPEVVERVRGVMGCYELAGRSSLVVDGTGLGAPVVDALRVSLAGLRGGQPEITAVTMTSGERAVQGKSSYGIQRWNVPKRDLISGVQMLLESGQLRIAKDMRGAGQLMKELLDIRLSAKASGRMRMGADGWGEHDDLVIALALACWRARKARGIMGGGRLPGI